MLSIIEPKKIAPEANQHITLKTPIKQLCEMLKMAITDVENATENKKQKSQDNLIKTFQQINRCYLNKLTLKQIQNSDSLIQEIYKARELIGKIK